MNLRGLPAGEVRHSQLRNDYCTHTERAERSEAAASSYGRGGSRCCAGPKALLAALSTRLPTCLRCGSWLRDCFFTTMHVAYASIATWSVPEGWAPCWTGCSRPSALSKVPCAPLCSARGCFALLTACGRCQTNFGREWICDDLKT